MSLVLAEIWVYPVKSLGGGRLAAADVDDRGLVQDRRFMVVDERARFVTQRERPSLALLHATIVDGALEVAGPSGRARVEVDVEGPAVDVSIWGETVSAVDAGDTPAALLSEHVGISLRLVRMPSRTRRPADPEYARATDLVAFADGFPFLVVNGASLEDLARRLGGEPRVEMRRFRPNLVVEGAPAWAEDEWTTLEADGLVFHAVKPCSRCAMVDVDPERGEAGRGVLSELGRFRRRGRAIVFGQNLVHDGPGRLHEGAPVQLRPP